MLVGRKFNISGLAAVCCQATGACWGSGQPASCLNSCMLRSVAPPCWRVWKNESLPLGARTTLHCCSARLVASASFSYTRVSKGGTLLQRYDVFLSALHTFLTVRFLLQRSRRLFWQCFSENSIWRGLKLGFFLVTITCVLLRCSCMRFHSSSALSMRFLCGSAVESDSSKVKTK